MSLLRQGKSSPVVGKKGMEALSKSVPTMIGKSSSDLLTYEDIPEWYQDNALILRGYRPMSNSIHACFTSLFALHNETVNIYSHLIPGIAFVVAEGLVYRYLHTKYPTATISDYLIFVFFLLTAIICFLTSATYHTFASHSKYVSNLWLRLDFIGIITFILGDFASWIAMVFYCESTLKTVYWAIVCRKKSLLIMLD